MWTFGTGSACGIAPEDHSSWTLGSTRLESSWSGSLHMKSSGVMQPGSPGFADTFVHGSLLSLLRAASEAGQALHGIFAGRRKRGKVTKFTHTKARACGLAGMAAASDICGSAPRASLRGLTLFF